MFESIYTHEGASGLVKRRRGTHLLLSLQLLVLLLASCRSTPSSEGNYGPLTPPLQMGKIGTIHFVVDHLVSPTQCLVVLQFPNGTKEEAILRLSASTLAQGQEVQPSKAFQVTGSQNYIIFRKGSVSNVNSLVLEEVPPQYHGAAETFIVESGPTKDINEPVNWTAYSRSAVGITGDVALSRDKIHIGKHDYALSVAREIGPDRFSDIARLVLVNPTVARLYKVTIPRAATFVRGNEICSAQTNWMLAVEGSDTVTQEHMLVLSFFSGSSEPDINYKAVDTSQNLCGIFSYSH